MKSSITLDHMVNNTNTFLLDDVFSSSANPIRQDILSRLRLGEVCMGEIAQPYHMSLVAISERLKVFDEARLIRKRKEGKGQVASLCPLAMAQAVKYLKQYGCS